MRRSSSPALRRSSVKASFPALGVAIGALVSLASVRAIARRLRRVDLRGKSVVVMGGSRGLGLDVAREAAAMGSLVAICARDPDEVDRARADVSRHVAHGGDVFASVCDAADEVQVARFLHEVMARFGGVDVLVTNAATLQVGPVEAMTRDDFEESIRQIFWTAYVPTMAVLPHMRRRRAGRIVHVTSFGGKVPAPHLLPYSTAKFAATGFSGGLRAELAKDGIRVTTVAPGLLRTGAYVNAPVKGQHAKEYAGFALGITLPFVSMSSARAARAVLDAAAHGDAERTLSVATRLATIAYAVAPGLMARVLDLQTRLLPSPTGGPTVAKRGADVAVEASGSPAVALVDALGRASAEAHHAYPGPVHVEPRST
jgi:NAD(P)-dependent dehydrogenase (short-subunit alcohol dehydrogenase family)